MFHSHSDGSRRWMIPGGLKGPWKGRSRRDQSISEDIKWMVIRVHTCDLKYRYSNSQHIVRATRIKHFNPQEMFYRRDKYMIYLVKRVLENLPLTSSTSSMLHKFARYRHEFYARLLMFSFSPFLRENPKLFVDLQFLTGVRLSCNAICLE